MLLLIPLALAGPDCAPLVQALDAGPRCLTGPLQALAALDDPADRACAEAALAARGLPGLPAPAPRPLPAPPEGKGARDVYGVPNEVRSDNFAVRWGQGFSEDEAERVAEAFERAWQVELLDMGYPAPETSDAFLFNVYIGDTGQGAPSSYGAAGYYFSDREGYPMIVLALTTARDMASRGRGTTAHEFFHAVQDAADTFAYQGVGAWYYEATASWIEVEVYPDAPEYAEFLFGLSFFPHLPIHHFDYPDEGTLEEYHQYGAFLFPRHLAEHVGDWRLIRDSWLEAGAEPDPLVVLDGLLQRDFGLDIGQAFFDFAARNATWDYAHGDWYAAAHEAMAERYPRDAMRPTVRHPRRTEGLVSPPDALLPQRFGANHILLDGPEGGAHLRVRLETDPRGSRSSAVTFSASLSASGPEGWVRRDLDLPLPEEGLLVEGFGEAEVVWLTVAAVSPRWVEGEVFGYAYALEPEDAEPLDTAPPSGDSGGPPPEDPGGCGCAAAPGPATPGAALGWLLALAALRRRP